MLGMFGSPKSPPKLEGRRLLARLFTLLDSILQDMMHLTLPSVDSPKKQASHLLYEAA